MQTKLKKGLALLLSVGMVMTLTCGAWAEVEVEETYYLTAGLADTPKWAIGTTWGGDATAPYPGSDTLSSKAVLDKKGAGDAAITLTKIIFDKSLAKDLAELNVPNGFDGKALELKASLTTETLTIDKKSGGGAVIKLWGDGKGALTISDIGVTILAEADNTKNVKIKGINTDESPTTDPLLLIGATDAGSLDGKGKITLTKNIGLTAAGLWTGPKAKDKDNPVVQLDATALKASGLTIALAKNVSLYAGDADDTDVATLTAMDGEFTVKSKTAATNFKSNAEGNFVVHTGDDVTLSGTAKLNGTIKGGADATGKALMTGSSKGDFFTLADPKGINSITAAYDKAVSKLKLVENATLTGDDDGLILDGNELTITNKATIKGTLALDGDGKLGGSSAAGHKIGGGVIAALAAEGGKLTLGENGTLTLKGNNAVNLGTKGTVTLKNNLVEVSKPEMVEGPVTVESLGVNSFKLGNTFLISKDATLTFDVGVAAGEVIPANAASTITNNGTLVFASINGVLGKYVELVNNNVLAISSIANIASPWKDGRVTFGPGYTLRIDDDISFNTSYVFNIAGGASFDIKGTKKMTLVTPTAPNVIGEGVLELHNTQGGAGAGIFTGALYLGKDAGLLLDNDGNKIDMSGLTVSADAGATFKVKDGSWNYTSIKVKTVNAKGAVLDTSALAKKLSEDKVAPAKVSYVILNTVDDVSDDKWPTVSGKYVYVSGDKKKYDIPFVALSTDKSLSIIADASKATDYVEPTYTLTLSIDKPAGMVNNTITVSKDDFPLTWTITDLTLKNSKDGTETNVINESNKAIKWTLTQGGEEVDSDDKAVFTVAASKVEEEKDYTLTVSADYTPTVTTSPVTTYTIKVVTAQGPVTPEPVKLTSNDVDAGATIGKDGNADKITTTTKKAPTKLVARYAWPSTPTSRTVYASLYRGVKTRVAQKQLSSTEVADLFDSKKGIDIAKMFTLKDNDYFKIRLDTTMLTTSGVQVAARIGSDREFVINDVPTFGEPVSGDMSGDKMAVPLRTVRVNAGIPLRMNWTKKGVATTAPANIKWSATGTGVSIDENTGVLRFANAGNNPQTASVTVKADNVDDVKFNVVASKVESESSDSGGGCAAGFAGLALLVVAPMFLKKK